MKINSIDQQEWSIDTLNKAYRQGYMFGLSGESLLQCPYKSDVIAAAWEAGWNDGNDQASVTHRLPEEDIAIA
ncbi:ribosome modulation factor [Gammaproteobacteria bacterium 42_54_T18]|nr:ribosome modulation factor [Gammaproteobacteria bacterium 42_54_T18]